MLRLSLLSLVTAALLPAAVLAAGDVEAGKALYAPCIACHGQNGEGNPELNSPGYGFTLILPSGATFISTDPSVSVRYAGMFRSARRARTSGAGTGVSYSLGQPTLITARRG